MSKDKKAAHAPRFRSPKYPIFGLSLAIERIRTFWKADQGAPATKQILATHWGFSSSSSGFLQAVSTVKQYGLLDTTGDGRLKPSQVAQDILMLDRGDERYRAAIVLAAEKPPIFKQLRKEWRDTLPSDGNMQHHIVSTMGFRPAAAKTLVKSFRNTVDFARMEGYDSSDENSQAGHGKSPGATVVDFSQFFGPTAQGPQSQDAERAVPPPHMDLTLPRGNAISIRAKKPLTSGEYAKIKSLIELTLTEDCGRAEKGD